jgi:hypothetical protein
VEIVADFRFVAGDRFYVDELTCEPRRVHVDSISEHVA